MRGGGAMTINEGYIVLDDNSDIVDWFDDFNDAEEFIEENEEV